MTTPIVQTVPLGAQWPTLDPFLFCAHHLDVYPQANGSLGPAASLEGRQIGQDFAAIDGWNMYHGAEVPGFPQHPHRGFETVTYVRRGWCDHSDSLGAQARFGEGDVQWLTAGSGIVHSEMFPLFDADGPNPLHLFQIWLNLPAASKMVDPYFSMFWANDIPIVRNDGVTVTMITGSLVGGEANTRPALKPPPDSWASRPGSDVAIWHLTLEAEATWTIPATSAESTRVLYIFESGSDVDGNLKVAESSISKDTGVVLDAGKPVELQAGTFLCEALLLQGRPIGEPVAQYGPFVMNDEAQIRQAMLDYQQTRFGGWPWPSDGPVHGADPKRFVSSPDSDPTADAAVKWPG